MAKQQQAITMRPVWLDNKSRRGPYMYVKAKGKRGAYYKVPPDGTVDWMVGYYRERYIVGKKAVASEYRKAWQPKAVRKGPRTRAARQAEQYLAKARKRGTLQSQIPRGLGVGKVRNILVGKREDIHKATRQMFGGLVLDKQLLDVLVTEENLQKLANRIEVRASIKGETGQVSAEATAFRRTPLKAVKQLKDNIQKGEEIRENYQGSIAQKLYQAKWVNWKQHREDHVSDVDVTFIFRKG